MDLRSYLKKKFGKNVFSIKQEDLIEERVKSEKNVERLSADIRSIQEQIRKLMLEAKGQTRTLKMLNVQKIKSLRMEAASKQQQANHFLRELQVILLIEAMREQEKLEKESDLVERIMNTDMEQLSDAMVGIDVKKAIEEGRLDLVKGKLSNVFGKDEETPTDDESEDIMKAIEDLEQVDEETAIKMAGEKAKSLSEDVQKKKPVQEKE